MTRKQEIAQTILEQLSGRRFLVMTGAKNLLALESGLQMQIPGRGSKKVVRIVLNGLDLYDLELGTLRSTNYRVDRRFDDVYAEQLQDLFTEATGLGCIGILLTDYRAVFQ